MQTRHLVSVPEIAMLVRKDESTVYKWIKRGKIQGFDVEGIVFVDGYETLRYEASIKTGRPRHAVPE